MSVTIIGIHPETGEAEVTEDTISTSLKYRCLASSYADSAFDVLFALSPLTIGSGYVSASYSNPNLRVRNISAERQDSNSLIWIATVDYEQTNEDEEDNQEENPLLEPAKIKLSTRDREIPVEKVLEGESRVATDGFRNSAGELFDPQPTKQAGSVVLTISRNEPITSNAPTYAYTYKNAINSDQFWFAPAGYAMCESIEVERQTKKYENGSTLYYLSVSYTFHLNPEGFDLEPLDCGSYYLKYVMGEGTFKIAFKTDDAGETYTGLLDGSGGKLADGEPAEYLGPYQIYPKLSFATLSLPQSF